MLALTLFARGKSAVRGLALALLSIQLFHVGNMVCVRFNAAFFWYRLLLKGQKFCDILMISRRTVTDLLFFDIMNQRYIIIHYNLFGNISNQ